MILKEYVNRGFENRKLRKTNSSRNKNTYDTEVCRRQLRMNSCLKKKRDVYLVYSGLYCLLFFFCFEIYLLIYHKSILWKADTFEMHYLQFLWVGRWVRHGLMTGEFPLWNPAFGYGADFLAGGISCLSDPLNWIAVIIPERFAEAGFHLVTFLRLYFCGLTFTWFGLRREQPPYAVLCGSILYTFCAYAYLGLYQSGFLLAMAALPLLIAGTDDLFEKKKSVLYVATFSYCALNSFYLTYMLALLIIAYFFLKFCFQEREERTLLHLARLTSRFLFYSIWAAAIAAVSLVPAALFMSGMSRMNLTAFVPLFYDKGFYSDLYKALITSYNMLGRDCEIGFSVLAVICVIAFLLVEKPGKKKTIVAFVLMTLGLCIPFVGYALNGFGYIANRWVWAYDFVIAWICVRMIPVLKNIEKRTITVVLAICVLYVILAYTAFEANGCFFLVMSIALILTGLLLFFFPRLTERQYQRLIVCLTCITVILPAYFQYSSNHRNYFGDNIPAGQAYDLALKSGGMPLLNQIESSDGTRYNAYGLPVVRNASWLYGVSGVDYYWNIYNSRIDDFHNSLALHTQFYNYSYEGLDRRSELMALLGVNHFFTDVDTDLKEIPAGFEIREAEINSGDRQICSYRPAEDNSLFSLFRNTLSTEEYEKLTPLERQQALLQACVLNTNSAKESEHNLILEEGEVPYRIETESGLTAGNGKIVVSEPNAAAVLSFKPQTDGEFYLYFEDLHFENGTEMDCTVRAEALSGEEVSGDMTQSLQFGNNRHHMYGGKHNWLLNFGRISEPIDAVRLTFRNPGTYSFQSIKIYTRSTTSILENISRLNNGAEQVAFSPDAFSLTVSTPDDAVLFAAIPYGKGWQATDNGEPVEVLCADGAFMAVELKPGTHELVFHYHDTPLTVGLIICVFAVVGYAVFEIRGQKRAGKK